MKSSLSAFCCLILSPWLRSVAQDAGVMLHEESLITESVHFLLPDSVDSESYTEQDWVMLSPFSEVRRESRTIDMDGSENYTILIEESSGHREWEQVPLQIVSDEDGMRLFDKEGELLDLFPHSTYYKNLQDSLKLMRKEHGIPVLRHLPYLMEMDQEILSKAGIVVTGDHDHYQVKSPLGEVEVDHPHRYIIQRRFEKEVGTPFYEYTSYRLTNQGYLIPHFRKVHQLEHTYSGFCVEQVFTWQQSESVHYVSPAHAMLENTGSSDVRFHVFPNPVIDKLTITTTKSGSASTYSLFIYNNMYDLVLQRHGLHTAKDQRVDLSGLPPGYYHLRIHHARENYSFKIFKQ